MNTTLQAKLRELSERNGTRLVFNQDERGTWRAFIKSVRLHLLWAGNLADMWRIAKGRI